MYLGLSVFHASVILRKHIGAYICYLLSIRPSVRQCFSVRPSMLLSKSFFLYVYFCPFCPSVLICPSALVFVKMILFVRPCVLVCLLLRQCVHKDASLRPSVCRQNQEIPNGNQNVSVRTSYNIILNTVREAGSSP